MAMNPKASVMYDYLVTGKKGQKKPKPGKGGVTAKPGQGPNTGYGKASPASDSNCPVVKKGGGK